MAKQYQKLDWDKPRTTNTYSQRSLEICHVIINPYNLRRHGGSKRERERERDPISVL